jgi:NADPH:quinone reductase-like Zn-dependent oxidoreductase
MKAIVCTAYGAPEQLELRDVDLPSLAADRVLLRVRAASVNAADWRMLRGRPMVARPLMGGLLRPKDPRRGGDVAGVVEEVGESVTGFRAGDEVFGSGRGAFAEYVAPLARALAPKPAALTFEQAAALPTAGITALQALRDHGRAQAGQRVLINGAGGGVGTFCVQIARAFGAEVTAVCGRHNVELVRSLGAVRVVDYGAEDFARTDQRYDLIVDNAGSRSVWRLTRLLTRTGTLVVVGAHSNPIGHMLAAKTLSPLVRRTLTTFVAKIRDNDLSRLAELAEAGDLTPVIDRTYPLDETAEALRYLEAGHARGKVVIAV